MTIRLENKTVAVTGGGSGIGEAICRRFAKEGARVAVIELVQEAAQQTVKRIRTEGGEAHAFPCDVTDLAKVKSTMQGIVETYGNLTTLVNNAGIAHIGNLEQTSPEDLDRIYRVNIKGVYNCLFAAIPLMKLSGSGAVVNMASVASTMALPDRFAYSMSKGAVLMMTRSVACDYLEANIRCNCISPARVHTPFVDKYLKDNYPGQEQEMFEKLSTTQPMGRMAQPDEIASLAVYLASDESAFVTGANYEIDGGFNNLKP